MYTISVYHTLDNTLLQRWRDLWNSAKEGHFFNSPEWFLTVCGIYSIKDIVIITIEKKNTLLLVFPLVQQSHFGVVTLTSPGGKFVGKSSLLFKFITQEMIDMLLDYLVKQGNFYLQELSEKVAAQFFNRHPMLIKKEASVNPYLSIFPDPFIHLSSKNKSQIRGIIRKHSDALSFKTFIGDKDALETAFQIDKYSLKRKQGKATFVTKQDKLFFRELVKSMPNNVMIDIVYYYSVPIVYGIGFVYKHIYYAANTAFDWRYRFLRPGKLFAQFRLRQLREEGYTFVDFGRGNSMLKQEFTKAAQTQYDVFYIGSFLSKRWLLSTQKIQDAVVNNKLLYTFYLFSKSLFYTA